MKYLLSAFLFITSIALAKDKANSNENLGSEQAPQNESSTDTAPQSDSSSQSNSAPLSNSAPQSKPAPQWLLSYNYYKYNLEGDRTANTEIYKFGKGSVDLHLISATWLYSSKWTFVALLPWIRNEVETIYLPSMPAATTSTNDVTTGIGDLRLMAISPLWVQDKNLLMYDVGFTVPTGSTTENFSSSLAKSLNQRASYNMQPGSGTPDLILGTSYTYTATSAWVNTARGQVTMRGGKNAQGWNLGTEYQVNVASRYQVLSYINLGVVGNFKSREPIQGREPKYEKFNNFSAGSIAGNGHQYYHAHQTSWDTSAVAKLHTTFASKYTLSAEIGLPFWQGFINKDEIDLNIQNWVSTSLVYMF